MEIRTTKVGRLTARFCVQVTQDEDGQIHMWTTDADARAAWGAAMNFSPNSGTSGDTAWAKPDAVLHSGT